jgi:hypothetical protein
MSVYNPTLPQCVCRTMTQARHSRSRVEFKEVMAGRPPPCGATSGADLVEQNPWFNMLAVCSEATAQLRAPPSSHDFQAAGNAHASPAASDMSEAHWPDPRPQPSALAISRFAADPSPSLSIIARECPVILGNAVQRITGNTAHSKCWPSWTTAEWSPR